MISRLALWMAVAATAASMASGPTWAQTALLDEVHTLSGGAAPIEKSFATADQGSYQLTFSDFGFPAPAVSAKLAVTVGTNVLGTASITAANPTATLSFDAPADSTVFVRIVGKPAAAGSAVNVTVTKVSATTPVLEVGAEPLQAPPPVTPENQAQLDEDFTATLAGTYEVSLTDLALPQALPTLGLAVTKAGGAQVAILNAAGAATFAGQVGDKFNVLALAEADASVTAGLFNVRVREIASGTVVLNRTVTLGRVQQLGAVVLGAGPHVLSVKDFQFPVALTQAGAALTLDGQIAALTTQPGDTPFTAAAGAHNVYVIASAVASSSGSLGVEVRPAGGAALFSEVKTVGGAAGATPAYTFVADIAAAGTYHVRLADFSFPAPFTAAELAVTQGGGLLGTLSAPGTVDVTAAAGRLFIVLLAQPSTTSGGVLTGGVLGIDVTPTAGGDAVFETTQGVGNLFQSRKISATGATSYRVTLKDVGFPKAFKELGAVVTRGATRLGTVLGSSSFDFDGTAGNYFVNFIATPDATENAGTYGIRVADKPPNPTVTLSASPAEVPVGTATKLTWTSLDATSCVASDGWSGTQVINGSFQTPVLNAATTFKLECTGDGGSTTATVTVNTTAQSGSGGGGGSMGWLATLGLGLCLALRLQRRRTWVAAGVIRKARPG